MNKVLITGVNGFLGKHLFNYFSELGIEVYGTLFSNATKSVDNRLYGLDITKQSSCRELINHIQPHIIVHLAGMASSQNDNVIETYAVNAVGTNNLLLAVSKEISANGYDPSSIVIPSSSFVYDAKNRVPYSEEMELNATNHYGISKIVTEQIAQSYLDHLPITIIRPFNIIGPSQSANFFVGKLTEHFHSLSPRIELGNLDVARDFMDVRDFCRQLYKLLLSEKNGVYNFCSGRPTKLSQIVRAFIDVTGHRPEIICEEALVRDNENNVIFGDVAKLTSVTKDFQSMNILETVHWIMSGKSRLTN